MDEAKKISMEDYKEGLKIYNEANSIFKRSILYIEKSIQLDYNDYFIKFLRDNNYTGTDDEVLNHWLNDICISVIEEINGVDISMATPTRRGDKDQA